MSNRPRLRLRRLAELLLVASCGCSQLATPLPRDATLSDRLRQNYPDLANGLFVAVADFEDPVQTELFHLQADPQGPGNQAWSLTGGVAATGGRCLRVVLGGPADVLGADNSTAGDWLLLRDWRPYTLLVMSLYSPRAVDGLDLVLVSGTDPHVSEAHSGLVLQPGWNVLRLDLAEAADFVALDDVRAIRWAVPDLTEPLELRLDDILLTDNRALIYGSADPGLQRLYVSREGRGFNVGVGGRFELGFSNGQIVRWYALEDDRSRLTNLLGAGNALGPTPVLLGGHAGLDVTGFAAGLAAAAGGSGPVTARQRVIEANDLRVIVECAWELPDSSAEGGPAVRWIYTVYRSGQVYVSAECVTELGDFRPERLAWMCSCLPWPQIIADVHEPTGLEGTERLRQVTCGWLADGVTRTGALWIAGCAGEVPRLVVMRSTDAPQVGLVAAGEQLVRPRHRRAGLLTVWPKGSWEMPLRETVALAYCGTPRIECPVGRLLTDTPGDEQADGFNERWGTFMAEPAGNRLLLRIDGSERPLVDPVFCIHGSAGREAWVYLDNVIHSATTRDSAGNLLFQLPGVLERAVALEVYVNAP